jgi:Tfp pilus assembly protein PilF
MVKKAAVLGTALLGAWTCASAPVAPPAFFVEDIPAEVSTRLNLQERIAVGEAWEAMKAGRVEQAAKLIAKWPPENPAYAVGLAYVDLLRGDLAAAETGFAASLQADPGLTTARVGLAQIHESRREREKVFNECREILKRDPENRWAKPRFQSLRAELVRERYDAGMAALKTGDRDKAKTSLLAALFYDPGSSGSHYRLGLIYLEEKDLASAVVHFEAFLALEKKDPESQARMATLYGLLAGLHYERGELGKSLEAYEKRLELEPQDAEALRRAEEIRAKLGIFELPSQYAAIPAAEAVTREELAALIGVKFESLLGAPGRRTEILVDISVSWAQRYIVKLASLEIMTVFDNHTFQPRRIINRAELADTAVRLMGVLQAGGAKFVPLVEARRIQVADVSPDHRYYQAIARTLAFQVMSLTPERMFEPERTVSGAQAIRVLDLILNLAK